MSIKSSWESRVGERASGQREMMLARISIGWICSSRHRTEAGSLSCPAGRLADYYGACHCCQQGVQPLHGIQQGRWINHWNTRTHSCTHIQPCAPAQTRAWVPPRQGYALHSQRTKMNPAAKSWLVGWMRGIVYVADQKCSGAAAAELREWTRPVLAKSTEQNP